MAEQDRIKSAIQNVIRQMMDRVMENVLENDPFIVDKHRAEKPLYAALVPDEIFRASHFERRFTTPFGGVWEKLAVVAAQEGLGYGKTAHVVTGTVSEARLRRITEVLNRLEHQDAAAQRRGELRIRPDWRSELAYILEDNAGEAVPVTVICDVYAEDMQRQRRFAFELKAPLPNSDQTKVSKEKLLKLWAMEPRRVDEAFFALPYNPYGSRENYRWSFPSRWFDMQRDEVVLIGNEFWEKIGGAGTYQAFIDAVNELGIEYKMRIYREFLGVEPPDDSGAVLR